MKTTPFMVFLKIAAHYYNYFINFPLFLLGKYRTTNLKTHLSLILAFGKNYLPNVVLYIIFKSTIYQNKIF
ncbi:MAG: hypothetical protein ACJAT4_000635 [Granulosicoccus sp.]|jgi:hypothetical protein